MLGEARHDPAAGQLLGTADVLAEPTRTVRDRVRPRTRSSPATGGIPVLVRALRRPRDLAVSGQHHPRQRRTGLIIETLTQRNRYVAVAATHPLAQRDSIDIRDLGGQRWTASRASSDEPGLGVSGQDWSGNRVLPVRGGDEERRRVIVAGVRNGCPSLLSFDRGPARRNRKSRGRQAA